MTVTITDVAKMAGVSKSTVSQFLNHRYNFMSADTKLRIRTAIDKLNYQPNQIARSLKKKKTNLIAIVASNLFSRFTVHLVSAIENEVSRLGYEVILSTTNDDSKRELQYLQSFISRQVDGIIVFPTIANEEYYTRLSQEKFPLVFVDRYIENVSVDTVILDNFLAAELATEELIKNNHRRIGILLFPLGHEDSITPRRQRLDGYFYAMQKYGLETPPEYTKIGDANNIDMLIREMMTLPMPPTAIIAGNDVILEKVLLWSKEENKQIPLDYSLIGIDDVSVARFYTPSITTISQPVEKMGTEAAQLLLKRIAAGDSHQKIDESTFLKLPPKIIKRNSVRKIRVE
ncbi:LacI family DNA-binding transcriptional regulator [Lapidilactobacillus bayanensis]|uniref:LacI family DNA-binding transcriptional regulator n=1 Tax=Lapidilactobacillus bayanensis TaxID=2485998 RepID=UPI000F79FF50|nr:LacI family DNA-binding transcriptional regulator [Lapidilactobacillus bayanensis]